MDENKEKNLYKHVYYKTKENSKFGSAIRAALDINTNVNNLRFIRQYQWS
jgi:hypothetical protein